MTDKEIRIELKENEVNDNPFDVMLYHSLELTRALLFASHRLKNPEVPEQICTNKERLSSYMNIILKEFSKLTNMSDETVAMCRETSCYYNQDKFNELNKHLLEVENNIETVWNKCMPNRDDRYEQIRLGKDSNEYKRLIELRHLIDNSYELSSVNDKYLWSMIDVISNSDIEDDMSKEEIEEKQKIIEKYNLSENDIEYMISYYNSKKSL